MASKNNVVETILRLNALGFRKALKQVKSSAHSVSQGANKSFGAMQDSFKRTAESIGLDTQKLMKNMKQLGTDTIKGGAALGLATGFGALTDSVRGASRATLDFDRDFKKLAQRFDFSKEKVKKLRDEYKKLSGDTGVLGSDLTGAGNNLLAVTGGKSTDGLKDIAQFAKLSGNVSAEDTSRQVVDFLKGSGQDISGKNIKKVLQSALALNRGGDFSLEEALSATTSSDGNALNRAGLSTKENAALLAGATRTGQDRGSTTAGIQALVKKSVEGFGKGSALQGLLGVSGGSLLKDGKFDISKLGDAAKNFQGKGLSEQDSVALLQQGGLSESEAEGIYSILKDFDKFHEGFQKTLNDQKSLDKAFSEGTDNMDDSLSKLRQKISGGVDDIVKPLSGIGNDLIKGDFSGALSKAPGALKESAGGMMDNKALVGTILGGAALTGGALRKMGLFSGAGGLAKEQMYEMATGEEVQKVLVINADEIGSASSSALGKLGGNKKLLGGLLGKVGGAKGMLGGAKVLGGVAAAGAAGYGLGTLLNDHVIEKTNTKSSDGFEGNIVEQGFHAINKLFNTESYQQMEKANKIQLEIDSKDNGFKVKPKRQDKAIEVKGI